ncbi:DUF7738 domain-containing protein [Flavobacterium hydrophilum]|uniref:DUF7738 domain-containing protein n=1 Tax=Flavobacterium hydrophilum TaxID=2211445 RepID=A0A2V4C9J9_9FLAO|nr:hypothetical protein [Flavobacterium hydrophilum]PXY46650.1 hypothetical protein DMB68_05655 [Flavobacterium hydrophilum]
MKQFAILILSSILMQCQTSKKETMPKTDFYISEHTITYKSKELPFGKSVAEWVKIFGKYDRIFQTSVYIWDDIGIYVSESDKDNSIDELHIFFMNLDSPLGQKGKLEEAKGRVSVAFIKEKDKNVDWLEEEYKKEKYERIEERNTTGSDAPKNFIYPFKIFSKSLNIEGAEVKAGMKVSDINKKRETADLPVIKYYDADMNSKNEDGSLTTLSNGYFTTFNGFDNDKERSKADFYNIMYRQTEGEIEYIRIVHDKGQEYFKF